MLIFGFKTRLSRASDMDTLKNGCPQCGRDLELNDLKKWFTLYFIPLIPLNTIETLYHCKNCQSSYKKEIKESLGSSGQNKEKIQNEVIRMMALTLTACMTHMAKIDGKIDPSEKKEILKVTEKFSQFKKEIDEVYDKVAKSKNTDFVFNILTKARQILTTQGIMMVLGQAARVLLADGKIAKKEETLMKEYMLVLGVPRELYSEIITNVKKHMV